MSDLTGRTLGQYEIVERVGEGGMATVYRARQPRLKRDVAIKVMLPELAAAPTFRERFEREAQAIANLQHPNILTVFDYGETDDGQLYQVVGFVRGGTLRQRLKREPMPPEETIEIVAQVAEALDYAHRRDVIHRDVKPNNILLTQDNRPLLADFGLAKPIQSDRRLTASGVMLGTPDYVAPEQARALEIDGRADIYALGVMLFEMLTGQHPYEGETPISIIIKHVSEPMPRPSEFNPNLSPALDEIVAKATAKSPDERYQRAGEMARALRAALVSDARPESSAELVTPPPTPPHTLEPVTPAVLVIPRPWYQQTRLWIVLAAMMALVVVAVLVLLSFLSKEKDEHTIPAARPGEVMILIAQFKAQEGSERYDVSQRIYNKLSDDLRQFRLTDVTAYQVPDVIESSEAALALGNQYGATLVIWGFYDDIGISPNIESVDDRSLSLSLERFNLETGEAADFKLYIAKELPEELSFLTALSLVQTFMLRGDMDKTMIFLTMAGSNLPQDPQFRSSGEMVDFTQGMMAFFQGDMEEAVAQMNEAIAVDPRETLFYTMRSFAYLQMAEVELVLADLEQAIALEPRNGLAYLIKGAVTWMADDLEAASNAFDHLLELEPDVLPLYLVRASLGFEAGDLTSALDALSQMEKRDTYIEYAQTLNGPVSLTRGLVYEKMGQRKQATAEYARALEMDVSPDSSVELFGNVTGEHIPSIAYLFECTVYQVQGEIERALASCDKAIEVDPAYFDALWKLGQLYAGQGEWEKALTDYSAAIEEDPRWPWVYFLRAEALAGLGRADEAQADLTRALELDPANELRQQIENLRMER